MVGATAADFSFKRKDQAVTMASKSAVKVGGEVVQVDPQLLFQRLTIAGKSNLEEAMTYELCTFPPALFENCCMSLKRQLLLMHFGLPYKTRMFLSQHMQTM